MNKKIRVNPRFYIIFSFFQMCVGLSVILCGFFYFYLNYAGIANFWIVILIVGSYMGLIGTYLFYCGLLGIIKMFKKQSVYSIKRFKFEEKVESSIGMVTFHVAIIPVLVFLLLSWTLIDYFQSVSLFGLVIIPLIVSMLGSGLLYLISCFNFLIQKIMIKKKKAFRTGARDRAQILPSMTLLSIITLLAIPGYFLMQIISDPQFSPGLTRQIDLFVGGEDGYKVYRIPSLLIIPNGTTLNNSEVLTNDLVLAFCEGRKYSALDGGEIDIVMKRSADAGVTWSNLNAIVNSGNDFDNIKYGNQMAVFDNDTGMVFLFYLYHDYNSGEKGNYVINSTNGGAIWSVPKRIKVNAPSSGHGIQLRYGVKAGRLLVTSFVGTSGNSASVIYSDDHGLTWVDGGDVGAGDECEVVETLDGNVYITLRKNAPLGTLSQDHRQYAWSNNGGDSWSTAQEDTTLPTPICLGSICRLTDNISQSKNRILFSNPADYYTRARMTIRISYDECKTWSVSKLVYQGPSGYSNIGAHSDFTGALLFERGRFGYSDMISFVQFDLEWLE